MKVQETDVNNGESNGRARDPLRRHIKDNGVSYALGMALIAWIELSTSDRFTGSDAQTVKIRLHALEKRVDDLPR